MCEIDRDIYKCYWGQKECVEGEKKYVYILLGKEISTSKVINFS
jgi:hypothetical protein